MATTYTEWPFFHLIRIYEKEVIFEAPKKFTISPHAWGMEQCVFERIRIWSLQISSRRWRWMGCVILPSSVSHQSFSPWQHSWLNCLLASPGERRCLNKGIVSLTARERFCLAQIDSNALVWWWQCGCTSAAGSWSRTATGCQWCSWEEGAERGRLRTEGQGHKHLVITLDTVYLQF